MRKISTAILIIALLLSACAGQHSLYLSSGDGLLVTFLDVGQADATLIESGGRAMLIDGGGPGDSQLIYTVLRNKGISHLDYIIGTHPHADHVGGLAGALQFASAGVVYSPVTEYDTRAFRNFAGAAGERGAGITIPRPGETFMLGDAEAVILGPLSILPEDPNNSSISLKVTYGNTSFLFTGDAERKAELELLEAYGSRLRSTVLKAGHHGSNTSTTYPFLREVRPSVAVISCGQDNTYGHPHDDVLSRLRDADVTVYRTDMQGDISIHSDGNNLTVTTGRNAGIRTNPTEPADPSGSAEGEEYYIGNVNSLRFHRPSCSSLPAEHNQTVFTSRDGAAAQGYGPCGSCKP
jgi:competence protein ComEC